MSTEPASYIVLSIFGDVHMIMKISSNLAETEEYTHQLAKDWVCDNIGKNNFVDTFNEVALPQKPGYYVQTAKVSEASSKTMVKKINAIQVIEAEASGWTGKYKACCEKLHGCFMILSSSIQVMLKETHEKVLDALTETVTHEYDRIKADCHDLISEKETIWETRLNDLTKERDETQAEAIRRREDLERALLELEDKEISLAAVNKTMESLMAELDTAKEELECLRWRVSRGGADNLPPPTLKTSRSAKDIQTEQKRKCRELMDELHTNPPQLKSVAFKPTPKEKRLLLTESTDDLDEVIKTGKCTIDLCEQNAWSEPVSFRSEPHHN